MSNPFPSGLADYTQEITRGTIPSAEIWNKFGYNKDVDSASPEIIASWGGTFNYLTTASTLEVVSSSAQDGTGGTGVSVVLIYGVNENHEHVIEVVSMNGTTPVTTANSYFGVNRMANYVTGSSDSNEGTITVTATTGGSTQAQMPVGEGTTQQCIFHVGIGKIFNASYLDMNINKLSGGSSPRVTVKGWTYSHVTDSKYQIFEWTVDTSTDHNIQIHPKEPFIVTGRQIMWFEADTDTNNTVVNMRFGGKLIKA
jgi:hypothetical protein